MESKPTVLGTGLIALDAVVSYGAYDTARYWAGGTCGNVLAILSYLGWNAFPVARFNGDRASQHIRADLEQWGVRFDFVNLSPSGHAPIIVQNIRRNDRGEVKHSFSWTCPVCTATLPRYRPVHASAARAIASNIERPSVFFLDRVSRGSLLLAKESIQRGAVVVFEPSSIGDRSLFLEALNLAHVVKYSSDRLGHACNLIEGIECLLQIETLGKAGLRYQSRLKQCSTRGWVMVPGYAIPGVRDTAGAGDWTTAGLIDCFARLGFADLDTATPEDLQHGLAYSQALAAWSCLFEGPRGAMYAVGRETFLSTVASIYSKEFERAPTTTPPVISSSVSFELVCPACASGRAATPEG